MSDLSTLQLKEYDSLGRLYDAMPKVIRSSVLSSGQAFLWTCIDVSKDYIAIGTNVGQLFLYDRCKGVIRHQLSSRVDTVIICYVVKFLLKYHFLNL